MRRIGDVEFTASACWKVEVPVGLTAVGLPARVVKVRGREDLQATREICAQHGCPLEIILKDISTVRYDPKRLSRWAEVAMEVVEAC